MEIIGRYILLNEKKKNNRRTRKAYKCTLHKIVEEKIEVERQEHTEEEEERDHQEFRRTMKGLIETRWGNLGSDDGKGVLFGTHSINEVRFFRATLQVHFMRKSGFIATKTKLNLVCYA